MHQAQSHDLQSHARIGALDGVRGLAVLLVVMMHAMYVGNTLPGAHFLVDGAYVRLVGLGWCGVDVFFVLSGFLITGILVRSKGDPHYFRNFYARRALRIFPLYYVLLGLLFWWLQRPPTTAWEKTSYLLYLQNFRFAFGGDQHVDVARDITWSLAIEEQFYLLWPTVVLLASRRGLVRIAMVMVAFSIVARFVGVELGVPRPYFLTFCRLDGLAVGALLALLPPVPRWLGWLAVTGGAGLLVGTACVTGDSLPHHPAMQRWGLVGALGLASGILVLARAGGFEANALSSPWLRSLGRYSYCIYLVHFLVIERLAVHWATEMPEGLRQWLVTHLAPTLLLGLFGLVCLGASWLVGLASWHLFERHLLSLKRFFPSGDGRA